ncbi:unnamed protein product [Brassica oleracea]
MEFSLNLLRSTQPCLGRASQPLALEAIHNNLDGGDLEKTSYSYQDESNKRAPKVVRQSE